MNSPGWIEVVQHTKAWDPEMYQEAYIFNQPRFLSRRAFHFYPSVKQYLHLQVKMYIDFHITICHIFHRQWNDEKNWHLFSFPETTDSIISEIILQNDNSISIPSGILFIYSPTASIQITNNTRPIFDKGKSLIIVARWRAGEDSHYIDLEACSLSEMERSRNVCAHPDAPERMQYFGEAIFSDDYPGA